MKTQPLVTVLMPVYNQALYIRESLESMLNQTYTNLDILIVDDGSTDNTIEIVQTYRDNRIRIVQHSSNQGLIATLNTGLANTKGDYIAKMHGDDISLPKRIAKQIEFLNHNPEIGVLGTWFYLGIEPNAQIIRHPVSHQEIAMNMVFDSMIAHPTIVFRKSLIESGVYYYDPKYPRAEDYELWERLIAVTKFANFSEPLLRYRQHEMSETSIGYHDQQTYANLVRKNYFRRAGWELSDSDMSIHRYAQRDAIPENIDEMIQLDKWLYTLSQRNKRTRFFDSQRFDSFLLKKFVNVGVQTKFKKTKPIGDFQMSVLQSVNRIDWVRFCLHYYFANRVGK